MEPKATQQVIIEAGKTSAQYWRDLLQYRELFFFLTWRDILVRYKQTVIGILWSLIRPVLTMVIFTVIFGKIAKLPTEGSAPYPLMVFAALLPWQLFANAVTISSESIVSNEQMISKIYFPRMIIPLSAVITALIDFLIAFAVFLILMVWYQFAPGWKILLTPFFLLLALATSVGIGLFVSALNVTYRDFRYIIPFLIQLLLFVSPVGFSSLVIPDQWRLLYSLNPMVGVIDGFRWCLIGQDTVFYWPGLLASLLVAAGLLWIGIRTFRNMERTFADKI